MITLPFGSSSAYTDSFPAPPPKQITVNAETCFNLLQFKGGCLRAIKPGR